MGEHTFKFTLAQLEFAALSAEAAKRGMFADDLVKLATRQFLEVIPIPATPDITEPWFEIRIFGTTDSKSTVYRTIPLIASWLDVRMAFDNVLKDVDDQADLVLVTPGGEISCAKKGKINFEVDWALIGEILRAKYAWNAPLQLTMDDPATISIYIGKTRVVSWGVAPTASAALIRVGEVVTDRKPL